jgi:lysophospholipase L1-like esterase
MAPSRALRVAILAAPSLVVVLLLAGVEVGVRLALPRIESLDVFVTNPEQQAQFVDRNRVRIFEGDPLLFWRVRPNLHRVIWKATPVTTNAQGLRYPSPVGGKQRGVFRIVCVGDSVTFGFGVPRVRSQEPPEADPPGRPYPALLETWLRAANPGRAIEVIPLACPGYSSRQGLAWLRRDIGWLRPDVVTALFGWNDISRRNVEDAVAMPTSGASVLARSLVSRSQALLHLRRWLGGQGLFRRGPAEGWRLVMRVPRDEYVVNMLAIARLAREHGARPVILGPVYRDRYSNPPEGDEIADDRRALAAAAARDGIPYVEFPELTEDAWPTDRRLFSEHIHPNSRGHRLLAQELLRFLDEQHLLEGLAVPETVRRPPS